MVNRLSSTPIQSARPGNDSVQPFGDGGGGSFILLDWPKEERKGQLLRQGSCVVQFLQQGEACAFYCVILDFGVRRQPHFRVSWPQEIETVPLRRHERVEVKTPCKVHVPPGVQLTGELIDISAGGCSVFVPSKRVEKGAVAAVGFSLMPGLGYEDLQAVVKNVTKRQNGSVIGCAFEGVAPQVTHDIQFFVATTIERLRGGCSEQQRVLLIEDDLGVVEQMTTPLEDAGYEVASSQHILDAFHRVRLRIPDVILVKTHHPELPGWDICRLIHGGRGCERVPVLLYGPEREDMEARAREAGAQGVFVHVEKTLSMVQRALEIPEDKAEQPA